MTNVLMGAVVVLSVLTVLLLLDIGWKNRRAVELIKQLSKAEEERNQSYLMLSEHKANLEQAKREIEVVTGQRDSYRELIEEIQAERDTWMNAYYSQATGHDNAQRWMMRDHQAVCRQVVALGGKPSASPTVQRIREHFEQEHGEAIADYASGKAQADHEVVVKKENARVKEIERRAEDADPDPS